MKVDFFTGTLRTQTGAEVTAYWAVTDSGVTAIVNSAEETFPIQNPGDILTQEPITSLDLLDLDPDQAKPIIEAILAGGYLKKPGIKGKGDAVLFVLANEAVHELEQIARSEEL